MTDNSFNFGVYGTQFSDFINSVSISNTVDGKPVYYWVNQHGLDVPSDAGYIALINSTNIHVKNLKLRSNCQGVFLAYSNYTVLQGLELSNNLYGVWLFRSFNNVLSRCTESSNIVSLYFVESDHNLLYHNNFLSNGLPEISGTINSWDNGYPSGGNYWRSYVGVDKSSGPHQNVTSSDGIGDTDYVIDINNKDNFPLVGPINYFDAGTWNGSTYYVDIVSNSTISEFHFNPDEGPFVCFNATGSNGTIGFCRVAIPKELLWAEDELWHVMIGDYQLTAMLISNQNFTYLYFIYVHPSETIKIQGTYVIPEYPLSLYAALVMSLTTLTAISLKRKISHNVS